MKTSALIGLVLLILGILSFVVPVPRGEDHAVKVGDAKIGIHTESREKLPPAVGLTLLVGGVVAFVVGSRRT